VNTSHCRELGTANYNGLAQSSELGKFSYNLDDISQMLWSAGVRLDRESGTITFTVKLIKQYLFTHISADEMQPISLEMRPDISVSCATAIVPGTDGFTCELPGPHFPKGSFRGRFFGTKGEEIAGTFYLRVKNEQEFLDGGNVGAFIVKK
jgi:hypothetical protein